MAAERTLKTKILPLPRRKPELVELFRKLIDLSYVVEIAVTPDAITVQRHVLEGEEVLPEEISSEDLDADFLSAQLPLVESLEFQPEEHAYLRLHRAVKRIEARRLRAIGLLAPHDPELLAAFLGLDAGTQLRDLYGIPVYYYSERAGIDDKLMVVGAPTGNIRDAAYGITVDMGD